MKFTLKALAVAAVASASSFTFADEPTSPHSVSGNIGVLSSYNLRGITNVPENSGATLPLLMGYAFGIFGTIFFGNTMVANGGRLPCLIERKTD